MTNFELEQNIHEAFEKATPNVLKNVKSALQTEKGTVISMNEKKANKPMRKKWASLAAVFAFVVLAASIFGVYSTAHKESTKISLDVNPSVEISVNKKEKVLKATPLNADGEVILKDMNLEKTDLDVALNAILGSMLKNGYLSEIKNSILVSVDGKDAEKNSAMQQEISNQIEAYLNDSQIQGAILTQNIADSANEVKSFAEKQDISEGKANYILEFVKAHPQYKAEDLVDLSMNELNVLAQDLETEIPNVQSNGTASEKGYIGKEKAEAIALAHLGFTKADVHDLESEFDLETENGKTILIYEVEFTVNATEYDVDVDAVSGNILKVKDKKLTSEEIQEDKIEAEKDKAEDEQDRIEEQKEKEEEQKKQEALRQDNFIGESKAKSVALSHAGFGQSEVEKLKCKLDTEDGKVVYEIEFKKDSMEYEYELDPVTAEILKDKAKIDT